MLEIIEPGEVVTPPKPIATPDPKQSTEDDGRGTSPADVVTPPKSFSGKEYHADIEDFEGPYVITLNGTYATAGKEMTEDLKVEILPTLTPLLTATENGDYEPESPNVGFKKVTVAVPPTPAYEGSYTITENAVLPTNGKRMTADLTVNVPVGGNTLKTLLDATKSCYHLFYAYTGNAVADLISYNDTSEVTTMNGMFANCTAITSIPLLNSSKVTIMNTMFRYCSNLKSVPALDASQVTNFTNAFGDCSALTEFKMTGMKTTFGISASTRFTREALVEIITNCASGVTSGTTLVMGQTNIDKLTQDDIDALTAKGWTLA